MSGPSSDVHYVLNVDNNTAADDGLHNHNHHIHIPDPLIARADSTHLDQGVGSSSPQSQAPTPASSLRSHQRAASQGENSLVGQNVGQTAGSFGAGLQNVPPPISTQLPSTRPSTALVRQPQGQRLQSLPPISDLLGVGVPSILPTTLLPRPDTPVFQSSPLPFGTYTVAGVRVPIFGQNQNLFGQHQNLNTMVEKLHQSRGSANPYNVRADEIGPRHGIPGVGSLKGLLTPPGWELGNEPITEEQADLLYEQSRARAQEALDATVHEFDHLSATDRKQRTEEKNDRWDNGRQLDKAIRVERIKICRAYQIYKQQLAERANQQRGDAPAGVTMQPGPVSNTGQNASLQVQPYPVTHFNGTPTGLVANPAMSGGHLFQRLQHAKHGTGIHLPQVSPLSPSHLDPALVPATMDAVAHYYNMNKALIMQLDAENEHYLSVWAQKYRTNVPRENMVQRDPRAPVLGRVPTVPSNHQNAQFLRPGHPASYRPVPTAGPATDATGMVGPESFGSGAQRGQVAVPQRRATSVRGNPSGSRTQARMNAQPSRRASSDRAVKMAADALTDSENETKPQQNVGTSRGRYKDEIEQANLPTSTFSAEALAAGFNMKRKGSSAGPKPVPGPPKSEPRRKKQLTNPAEGMVVSSRGAQALIAKGAADRTKNDASTRQESGAVSTANSAAPTLPSNSGMPTGPRLGTFSTAGRATRRPHPHGDTGSGVDESEETHSDVEDPTYNHGRSGRSTDAARRSSRGAGRPATKRPRMSLDGQQE